IFNGQVKHEEECYAALLLQRGRSVSKRLYDKNQSRHFLVWLAICLVTSIVVINIEVNLGGVSMQTAAVIPLGVLSLILFSTGCLVPHPVFYLRRTGIDRQLGLGVAPRISLGRMWFYLP